MNDFNFTQIDRQLVPHQIADRIQAQIVERTIKPGDQLPSGRSLSAQFSVSRQCIREAYKILEERGLVEVHQGRGVFVIKYQPKFLQSHISLAAQRENIPLSDLLEVRNCLECRIASLAAQKSTLDDLIKLELTIQEMRETVDNLDAFIIADEKFHTTLVDATQNQLLSILIQPLINLVQEYRKEVVLTEGAPQKAIEEHVEIFNSIKERDPLGAQDAMRKHVKGFGHEIGIDLNG